MDEAFLELISEKDISLITITEICQKAGVNRSTFYLHYENINDLLDESIEYIKLKFKHHMRSHVESFIPKLNDCPIDMLYLLTPKYLVPFLEFIKEHRQIFKAALKYPTLLHMDKIYERMFRYVFTPILERCHVHESEQKYMMMFYIHGLMAIIDDWLKNDCAESVLSIAGIMQKCVGKM